MSESLNTVVVDDNPDDRALVIRELRREFPGLNAEEITHAKGFARALESTSVDLVITDFQLHWTDGLTVLRSFKARWPDCPVVMFTGTGSEEVAVEAMKAGLDDYILKSPKQYARLPAVAKLALKMRDQRRQLRSAEAKYATLFTSVPIGLYRATPQGELLEVNAALAEMLHFSDPAELIGARLSELHANPAEYAQWQTLMEQQGMVHGFQAQLRTPPGGMCWVENSARATTERAGDSPIFEGSLEDISHRKKVEQEREELISELQHALATVKTLSGLLPICAACKKIRDDHGYWNQIEVFIENHSDAEFTHSFCPDCMRHLYPELFEGSAKLAR